MSDHYKIIRHHMNGEHEVIERGLTLEEAQAHCRREDTHGNGWFDGYDLDDGREDGPITVERGPWRFVWHGGRTADVYHLEVEHAIDCTQVGHYDFRTGTSGTAFAKASLEVAADEWMQECSHDYQREIPYL